ncbi:aspartyl protease family protein 2-like [Phoenix dactylifera]|uniref:Aspartyl protease family protein 2-like n=1 Tax=Phoenix dactylifera TaxID=42345 RepID=A0A8B7BSF4_PHODC|nr:aspartyl protease family protein 2-like [Phoenix dactylifera]
MTSPYSTVPLFLALLLYSLLHPYPTSASLFNWSSSVTSHGSPLPGIELPSYLSFNAVTSSDKSSCDHPLDAAGHAEAKVQYRPDDTIYGDDEGDDAAPASSTLKLHLKHRPGKVPGAAEWTGKEYLINSTRRDLSRIQTLLTRRAVEKKKNRKTVSRLRTTAGKTDRRSITSESEEKVAASAPPELAGRLMATLESGITLGSGEYFIDVFVGTPPRHFSLILDTGSDLNWIQCLPCHDCFEQHGPVYDPTASSTYRNVSCGDPRCGLVSPPWPRRSGDQACSYFYWYGDHSNTTGDLALETFTVNLTTADGAGTEFRRVDGVIFGCGHSNRGLFHGAAGLLGLGRGPLSFSSQLRSLYGHTFSYCLVDRNSDLSVSSKLIFGEDRNLLGHPDLNYTSFVNTTGKKDDPADTFYYVHVKEIVVGREVLDIPPETWELSPEGAGGTIVDSGTTLSYFANPAYQAIKEAFVKKVNKYPLMEDFPILSPCYNVSGVEKVELPEFAIRFADGAVWNFPVENYFFRVEPEEIVCLAILGTQNSSLSILGNYQQQNFHIMYDLKKFRLGFAPMKCAQV